jgi:cysteine-rich repeat protein
MGGSGMGGSGMGGSGMGGSGAGGSGAGGSGAGGSGAGGSGSSSSSGSGAVCGDGMVMLPEACDDGNTMDDDACSSDCLCGDGVGGTIAFTDAATGHCYAAYPGAAPWFDASTACQAQGAYLATLTSQGEVDFVSVHAAAITDLWIGAQDLAIEGQWVWENGEPWLMSPCTVEPSCDPTINVWGMDQPDDYLMVEDCGLVWTYAFALNDYTCDTFLGYLCERSP